MYLIGFHSKKKLHTLYTIEYYQKSFENLRKKGVYIIYFYQEDTSLTIDKIVEKNIKNIGIQIVPFNKKSEVISYIHKLSGKIYIHTTREQEICFGNTIKRALHQKTTKNIEIFLNKYLQRRIIGKIYPETIVQYKHIMEQDSKSIKEYDFPPMPCIVKPTGGIQSSGVCKIKNHEEYKIALNAIMKAFEQLKNKKLLSQEILIEEYIDGKMYTIDYYIDEEQNITIAKPVYIKSGIDYGIDDFCNISRITSENVEKEINNTMLETLIQKTVKAGGLKNTFVHHEFKVNSKGIYKTIEINGRIGGYRLNIYRIGYGINLLDFPFQDKNKAYSLKKNTATFVLYPRENGIFIGFNEDIIEKIKRLKSFYTIKKNGKQIGDAIGLTKNGYSNLGSIMLVNKDYGEFRKDVSYIEKIYFDIIHVD